MDPANLGIGVVKLCEKADIDWGVYYSALRDPEFEGRLKEARLAACGPPGEWIEACRRSACDSTPENRNGAADRRLMAEMSGFLLGRHDRLTIDGDLSVTHQLSPDAEILWMYLQCRLPEERWRPQIRDAYRRGVLVASEPVRFGGRGAQLPMALALPLIDPDPGPESAPG